MTALSIKCSKSVKDHKIKVQLSNTRHIFLVNNSLEQKCDITKSLKCTIDFASIMLNKLPFSPDELKVFQTVYFAKPRYDVIRVSTFWVTRNSNLISIYPLYCLIWAFRAHLTENGLKFIKISAYGQFCKRLPTRWKTSIYYCCKWFHGLCFMVPNNRAV